MIYSFFLNFIHQVTYIGVSTNNSQNWTRIDMPGGGVGAPLSKYLDMPKSENDFQEICRTLGMVVCTNC